MSGSLWRHWRLASCWIAILLAGAPAGASVDWVHLEPGCEVASGDVHSGDEKPQVVGSFAFGPGLHYDGPCQPQDEGTWTPSLLPVEPAPRLSAAFPCAGGLCLQRKPGQPWVAVLDWPSAHGWSVAATIREASDQQVGLQLYDLTDAGTLGQWVTPVSDLHVLVQLCALAEHVRLHPGDRPLAVNMSFGRLQTASNCGSGSTSQSCPVGQVLSHLAAKGIVPVAAAGNHGELLFPASIPDVVSAGAIDLTYLQHTQKVRASRQTPLQAEALMPGYGLYLSAPPGAGNSLYWPAPPGSSYAAALFTGWLSGYRANGGQLPDPSLLRGAHWIPRTAPNTSNGLALTLDGAPLPGSELNGPRILLDRALGNVPVAPEPRSAVTLWLTGPAPPLPGPYSLLHADTGNGPQPGVDPCVPCGPGGGGQGGTEESSVLLDLSHSGGLPPWMDLLAVLLRVGTDTYAFDGSRDPDLLAALAAGSLEGLKLAGTSGAFRAGEQPSLVLVIDVGGHPYWHEVPFHIRWR